jgi:DUF1009 family protein
MIQAGATCLCLTARKTLIFDKAEMLALANRNKISIVAADGETIVVNPA